MKKHLISAGMWVIPAVLWGIQPNSNVWLAGVCFVAVGINLGLAVAKYNNVQEASANTSRATVR